MAYSPRSISSAETALVNLEIQRGVVGDLSALPALAEYVSSKGILTGNAQLIETARSSRIQIVHCTAEFRANRRGSIANTPMLKSLIKRPENMLERSPCAKIISEVKIGPEDVIYSRNHGVSPFSGTSLDIKLRHMGIKTLILTGV